MYFSLQFQFGQILWTQVKCTNITVMLHFIGSDKVVTEVKIQGPVIQSIVSLMSSLMTNSLTFVAKVFSNTLIFYCCQNDSSFCSYSHFFSKKKRKKKKKKKQKKKIKINKCTCIFQDTNFNVTLANNFVEFWTNGPWYFLFFQPKHTLWEPYLKNNINNKNFLLNTPFIWINISVILHQL